MIADRTKAGFAAAKARGIKLGNAKLAVENQAAALASAGACARGTMDTAPIAYSVGAAKLTRLLADWNSLTARASSSAARRVRAMRTRYMPRSGSS